MSVTQQIATVQWESCIQTSMTAPDILSEEDKQELEQELTQELRRICQEPTQNIAFNNSKHRLGNMGGLSLMKQLDQLRDQVASHESRLKALETHFSPDIMKIRTVILDRFGSITTTVNQRQARNAAAHGGNIIADMQAIEIRERTDPERATKWHDSFEYLYKLPCDARQHILNGHDRMVKICNIRANMLTTEPWDDKKYAGKLNICDMLVDGWKEDEYSDQYWNNDSVVTFANDIINWSERLLM